jgi:hypothetical protein
MLARIIETTDTHRLVQQVRSRSVGASHILQNIGKYLDVVKNKWFSKIKYM